MAVGLSIGFLSSSKFREKIRPPDVCCTSSPVVAAGRTHLADKFVTCSKSSPGVRGWSWKVCWSLSEHDFQLQPISIRGPLDASVLLASESSDCDVPMHLILAASPCRNLFPWTSRMPEPSDFNRPKKELTCRFSKSSNRILLLQRSEGNCPPNWSHTWINLGAIFTPES